MIKASTKACTALAALFTLSVAGCRCNERPITQDRLGDIAIIYDQDGTTITAPNGVYDFGKVSMGVKKTLKVTIQNRGQGVLDLLSIEKLSGDNVKTGELDEQPNVFTLGFTAVTLGAGESLELDAAFDAPNETDPSIKTKDHSVKLVVNAGNTAPGAGTADIELKGTAVSGECELPGTLDFGAVAVGDNFKSTVTITNRSPLASTVQVSGFSSSSGDDRAFTFAAESSMGVFVIEPGLSRDVVVAFTPTETKDYLALVKMRAAEQCPEVTVKLIGTGVTDVVTCDPSPADFGYVSPGLQVQGDVTLLNLGLTPVGVTGAVAKVGTLISQEYKVLGPDAFTIPAATRVEQPDGSRLLMPGTLKVPMAFKPTLLGPRLATLAGITTLNKQSMLACALKGAGGGPDIDVKPAGTMNFGKVPFFASAPSPFYVSRKVTVQNVGTAPSPPDARANLHLGVKSGSTNVKPYWRVVAKNAASLDSEICVGVWDPVNFPSDPCRNDLPPAGGGAYDPMIGIVATGTKALLDIPVRITPSAPNKALEWDVIFSSNDPDEPEVTVNVKAQSVVLPPCRYTITPTTLNFGLVTPPAYRDLSFAIKNLGTDPADICLITNLEMEVGSDPIYTLPNGNVDQYEMVPGETLNVLVRSWPQGSVGNTVVTAVGGVLLGISDPVNPQRTVSLTTSVAISCLTIAPDDLDFGTVQKDCNSSRRTFSIYNTCTQDVTVNSWGMIAPAGVPPGSVPSCPATALSCPEFLIDGTPGFSAGSLIVAGNSMPVTFALKYHPLDFGSDSGAFLLKVTQNGNVVDYIVTLKGAGDAVGRNVDTFRQDTKPKADILLVIDDSCSMADKQTQLSLNFASFIRYASAANVDYQLGVITTYMGSATEGQLLGDANNPRILKPSTPNVEALFRAKVAVGINGGTEGTAEPAVKALTAPLITGGNSGFLRADAVLAVVAVTDAGDQSPLTASIYENQLRNIKGAQRASQFSYNVIGPFAPTFPAGCSYDDYTDVSKHQYLVTRFNGVKDEICTPNWSAALEAVGKNAFGYRNNFFLTSEPNLAYCATRPMPCSAITVKIDGVVIDPLDVRSAPVWAYDALSNSVIFEPLFVPEPGKTLTIEYFVTCN